MGSRGHQLWLRAWSPRSASLPCLLLWLSGVTPPAHPAEIAIQFASPTTGTGEGDLLAAEAGAVPPAPDRSVIRARLPVTFALASGDATAEFRFTWRLLALQDAPVPLVVAGGTAFQSFTTNRVELPFGGQRVVNTVLDGPLRPATRLLPGKPYRLQVGVERRAAAASNWTPVGSALEAAPRTYWHFTNTLSGDAAWNILGTVATLQLDPQRLVLAPDGSAGFAATATGTWSRYDDFALPPAEVTFSGRLQFQLRDLNTTALVPLVDDATEFPATIASHDGAAYPNPTRAPWSRTWPIRPADPAALDRTHRFQLEATLHHREADGTDATDASLTATPVPLFFLNGRLRFGAIETRFARLANDPAVGATPDSDGVRTTLQIIDGSGALPSHPEFTYGDGTPLAVRVGPDGTAIYLGAAPVELSGAKSARVPVGRVRLGFARLRLSVAGLEALDAAAWFPAGAGFSPDRNQRVLSGRLPLGIIPLDASVQPFQTTFTLNATDLKVPELWFHHERLPVWLPVPSITWDVAGSRFLLPPGRAEFLREPWLAFLEDPARVAALVSTNAESRWGNDHAFRLATDTAGAPPVLTVDENGLGRLDTQIGLGAGTFTPQFPRGWTLAVEQGVIALRDGEIDTTSSRIQSPPDTPVAVDYRRDCPEGDCGSGTPPGELAFQPAGAVWAATPDGGWIATGTLRAADAAPGDAGADLAWGSLGADRFAHRVGTFGTGSLHVPGYALPGTAATNLAAADRAAALLFAGFTPTPAGWLVERPGTMGYFDGFADYAGLNLRVDPANAARGFSHIAGQRLPGTGTYPLKLNGKYYARPGGVSGRHQAAEGTIPPSLTLYGFPVTLDGLRFSYLDNQMQRSATDGGIAVPYPSDFTQAFAELRLGCNGQLVSARPEGEAAHTLAYWLTPFRTWTIDFRHAATADCATTTGVLLLGTTVTLPLIDAPVGGTLGFRPTGDLVRAADGIPGVDSRLALGGNLRLRGPGGSGYGVHPVVPATFNAWPGPGGEPTDGFVQYAGQLDLPFFEMAKVHLHALPGGPPPEVFVMGGWDAENRLDDPARAWVEAGRSFFNDAAFDPAARGWPAGVTLRQYRGLDPLPNPVAFRPRAQKRWLDAVEFDLPLQWDGATRSFGAAGTQGMRLLVFALEGRADQVTPDRAQLSFGARFDVPRFSLSEFLQGELENRTSLFGSVSNAIDRTLHDQAIARRMRDGAAALDDLLAPALDRVLEAPLQATFDPLADRLLDAVGPDYLAGLSLSDALCAELGRATNALRRFAGDLPQRAAWVDQLAGSFATALATADDGVTSALRILEPKRINQRVATEHRYVVTELTQQALRDFQDPAHPWLGELVAAYGPAAATLIDDALSKYVGNELEPQLAEQERVLRELHQRLTEALDELRSLRGDLGAGLAEAAGGATSLTAFAAAAGPALCAEFRNLADPAHDLLRDRAALKARVRRVLAQQLLASVATRDVQLLLRTQFGADHRLFHAALESLFQRVNDGLLELMRGPLNDVLAGFDRDAQRGLDELDQVLRGSRLHGHARLNRTSLEALRIDGHLRFALGGAANAPLDLDGFVEVLNDRNDLPARGCLPPGATAMQVGFGAGGTPAGGFAAGLNVTATGRFSYDGAGHLLGLAGGLGAVGSKRLGPFTATNPGLGFAFGRDGHYLGGTVSGTLRTPKLDLFLQQRWFVGEACRLKELDLIDADTAALLSANGLGASDPVIGFYVSADGAVPLEQLIVKSLPQQCLLDLEGRGGMGYFGFLFPAGGPKLRGFNVGYRQRWGIHGEALCLATFTGDLNLIGAVGLNAAGHPQGTIVGRLELGARVGWPVKQDITKSFPWTLVVNGDDFECAYPF